MHSTELLRHRPNEISRKKNKSSRGARMNLQSFNLYSQLIWSVVAFAVFISVLLISLVIREQQKQSAFVSFFFVGYTLKAKFVRYPTRPMIHNHKISAEREWVATRSPPPAPIADAVQHCNCVWDISKHEHRCKSGARYSSIKMSVTMTLFSFNFCVHSCDLFIAIAGAERGRPSTGAFSYRVGGKFQASTAVARP